MADNLLTYDANSAQQYIRTTDTAGVHVPHHIIEGFEGLTEAQLTAMLPLQVELPPGGSSLTDSELRASPVEVQSLFDPGTLDEFGHMIIGTVRNQVDIQYYRGTPATLTTVTTANGGTTGAANGMATFATTTGAGSQAKGVSTATTIYTAGAEIYAIFTAAFLGAGAGTSYHRLGLYNGTDGFFLGKEGSSFGVTLIKGGVKTTTPSASFSEDTLTGGVGSKFTRAGAPEAVDFTKINVWRIRFGWVGSAPVNFEILSPDGRWITFHKIRQPNTAVLPHINTADLPVTCDVNAGTGGIALSILSNCWAAGTTQSLSKATANIDDDTLVELGRSIIVGRSTSGGGEYVNVKATPSGSLNAEATVTGTVAVTAPAVTKGTQAANGFTVQNLKDAGRVNLIFWATAVASGLTTVETAITLTRTADTGASTTGASFVITSGKRFRITSLTFAARGHNTATAQATTFKLRVNTAGAVGITTTPIVLQARVATPATANSWDRFIVPIPDGFELVGDGTAQFGITAAAVFVTNAPTWDVIITGFEY